MPRPKRTKVAPSAPAARVTKSTITTKSIRKAPELVAQQIDDISDVEETSRTRSKRVKTSNAHVETTATTRSQRTTGSSIMGALDGSGKTHDAISSRLEAENTDSGNEKAVTISSAEMEDRLISSSPSIELSRREAPPSTGESSVLNVRNFRRRPREGSILGRKTARGRSSSVDSNIGVEASMVNAPRIENSVLAKGKFRRRAREPSILGGTVDRQRSSSSAMDLDLDLDLDLESTGLASAVATPAQQPGSALKFGSFRRRARQPSILGSVQRPRGNAFGLPDDDVFAPEDESTPLNLSKNRADVGARSQPPASSLSLRKRKMADIEVPQSSPIGTSESDIYGLEKVPATASQKTRVKSTPPRNNEEPELVSEGEDKEQSVEPETRPATPEAQNDTMAPPISSSPMPSIETPPRGQSIRSVLPPAAVGTRRQPPRNQPPQITATQDSPISSPPPLTHSPNYKKPAAARKAKEQKRPDTYSTAQLQNLLPRRRRRQQRDGFDVPDSSDEIDTSGLHDSDDELSHLEVRTRHTPAVPSLKKKPVAKSASKTTTPAKSSTKRTYASRRAASSDKENVADGSDEEMEDSLAPIRDVENEENQELEKRLGRELEIMKRKFEDVDKWELDFEEVTASSSSPKDAR